MIPTIPQAIGMMIRGNVSSSGRRKSSLLLLFFGSLASIPVLRNQPGAFLPQVEPVLPPPLDGQSLFTFLDVVTHRSSSF